MKKDWINQLKNLNTEAEKAVSGFVKSISIELHEP